jgi:exopolysaccharide production protein ExoQ
VIDGGLAQWTVALRSASNPRVADRRISPLETGFAWLGLMVASGGVLPILKPTLGFLSPAEELSGDPFAQAVWLAVYVVALLLLFIRLPRVIRALPALGTIWVLLALALASPVWSAAPQVTVRRSIALLGTTIFALYLGTRFTRDQFLRILFAVYVAVVPLSLVAGVLRIGAPAGVWMGSFSSKNLLGQAMVLSTIVSLLIALGETGWKRGLGLAITALSCALLVLSDSKTSAVVLFASVMLLLPLRVLRLRYRVAELALTTTLVGVGALAVWIAGNSVAVLNLLGRDATLTGRVQLWGMLWQMIRQNPWIGYGYGGFWLFWDGPSAAIWQVCLARYGWLPPNGHDGFIDLWLDLGVVGLAAFLIHLIVSFVRAHSVALEARSFLDLFPVMFLYFMVLANLTESTLVIHNSLMWVLFVTISIQLWPKWATVMAGPDPTAGIR